MQKCLLSFLTIVVLSLMCASGFAYRPIIGGIPDVWIGDEEDNPGGGSTVDVNFFRFSNAFNFDVYWYSHPDTYIEDFATTNIR